MSEPRGSTDEERAPLLERSTEEDTQGYGVVDSRSVKTVLTHPGLLTALEKGLLVLTIVLLCLAAVFGGLALGAKEKLNHIKHRPPRPPVTTTSTQYATTTQTATSTVTHAPSQAPTPPTRPPSRNDEICLTPTCVQISAAILDSIDTKVDPCHDFYAFANGNWLKAHPIPGDKGLFGAAQWIDQRNKDLMLRILQTPIDEVASLLAEGDEVLEADRQNLKDLNVFYSMCMDEDALDRRGSEPLVDVVEEVLHAWQGEATDAASGKKKSSDRKTRLTETLLLLHSKGIDALFSSAAAGDYYTEPDKMRLWLTQSGLGLPDPDYYEDKAVEKVYREVIRSALKDVYAKADAADGVEDLKHKKHKKQRKPKKGPTEAIDYRKVFDLERQFAKVFVDSVDIADPVLAYNAYNLTTLTKLAPFIHWPEYFSGFAPRLFPDPVIISTPSYFDNLSHILDKTSDDELEAYFVWKTVQNLGSLLGPRETARKEVTQLNNYLSGVEEGVRASREGVCLQSLLDNYGFMVGRFFVKEAFTGDSKAYAETIIKSAVQAFKDRLPELDWIDEKSRKGAEEKADAIRIKIGYATSPNVTSPVDLKNYYAMSRPIHKKFFESIVNVRSVDERKKWFQIGKQRDAGMWEMIPSEVNAYYTPEANEMAFPAGVLQAPYFSKDYPEYLGFGSMASLAGHELTHAFDSAGRQFDKTGKLTDWWTNSTIENYNHLTHCIEEQYAQYYVLGPDSQKYYVKSKVTLGEDIADGGGLSQTFRAWSDRFASDPKGEKYINYVLPGLNYTREQLFYMQFARGWARNIKPAEAVRRIRVDEHSPTNFRVIGPLSNSDEFSKAFNCPVGSRMNRKDKCKIW